MSDEKDEREEREMGDDSTIRVTRVASFGDSIKDFLKNVPHDLVPLFVLIMTIFLVIIYANDWKFWDGQVPVETTNDAYIRSDVTPLSTKVAGTVASVLINDYDQVKKGQLLVQLRNDDFTAKANQAEALFKQAEENIGTTAKEIEVQKQKIETARLATSIGTSDITRTTAGVAGFNASLEAARAGLEEARSQKAQAVSKLAADQAVALRAAQERKRQTDLFADNASTQQTVEQVVADDDHAKNIVQADKAEIARLTSLIASRTAEIKRIMQEVTASTAQNSQAQDTLKTRNAQLLQEQRQLDVLTDRLAEAKSLAKARKAAWEEAKVELDYTKVIAPVDGVLSERRVRAGQQVNAGTQVVTIVSSVPWVIASYRETQMRHIAVGQRAEVSVDALGGAVLKGKVQSLSPASEAQFALLPPDNPSGNFTKITQRLPIKIVFDPEQKELDRIKPGMTVITKVWTHL